MLTAQTPQLTAILMKFSASRITAIPLRKDCSKAFIETRFTKHDFADISPMGLTRNEIPDAAAGMDSEYLGRRIDQLVALNGCDLGGICPRAIKTGPKL